jgi:hypothetical protein
LRVVDIAELTAIRSHVSEFRTGQSIDAAGNRSAIDPAKMKASKLTDYFGEVETATAKVIGAVFGPVRRLSNDATFTYICELTVTFRVLA